MAIKMVNGKLLHLPSQAKARLVVSREGAFSTVAPQPWHSFWGKAGLVPSLYMSRRRAKLKLFLILPHDFMLQSFLWF